MFRMPRVTRQTSGSVPVSSDCANVQSAAVWPASRAYRPFHAMSTRSKSAFGG